MSPSHIRFYISDYGYGHASRCIALIRALQEQLGVTVSIRTKTSAAFVSKSLSHCVISSEQNDVGTVMYKDTFTVDAVETECQLKQWISSWDNFVAEECIFCRDHGVDLIVSDITPQAFLVSERLGIPGIGFSNFTWELIFRNLYGRSSEVKQIADAYCSADLALVLPFHESMHLFRKRVSVPLVCRKRTRLRDAMRNRFGVGNDEKLVYLGSGFSVQTMPDCVETLIDSGVKVLVSENSLTQMNNIIRIPNADTESQDYLGMCDLVITKPGYSTVSEAVSACVPLLIYTRNGFAEDPYITAPIAEEGFGRVLSYDEFSSGEWVEKLSTFFDLKNAYSSCSDMFKMDGTDMCIKLIGSYL